MIKSIKIFLATIAGAGAILAPALVSTSVLAQPNIAGSLCGATNTLTTNAQACATNGNENNGLNQIITLVINVFTVIVGFIAIVMMIYGGFKYITSGGDSGNVTAAKNTIMYALIGLVVVALAQLIVRFVLGKANNVTANVAMSLFRF
jgi:hypothetical protein